MAIIGSAEVEIRAKVEAFEKKLRSELQGAGGQLDRFGGVADRLEGRLKRLGITSQDLAVVMGAGLAGGAAFAAREVVRFVGASIEAASALREQEAASKAVFDTSSELVRVFAEQADSIGLSDRAALQATTTFGGFFQNIGLAEEASARLAVGFTALASDTASLFDIEPEVAIERIISGLRGEQDAVERLNVSINEKAVADRALVDSGKESVEQLTQGERVMARAKIITEQLSVAYNNFADTSEGLANKQRQLNARWEDAKAALGEALQPAAIAVTDALTKQLNALRALDDGYKSTNTSVTFLGIGFRKLIDGEETNALQKLKDIIFGFDETADDAASTTDELKGALDELNDPLNQAAVAQQKLADETDKAADAHRRLDRAIGDAERRVDRAETTLARAFEDSELRIDNAERALAEAFEDRSERIADAERKLQDERLQGFRSVRSARERLSDFERESERRVVAAETRILEIRKAQNRALLSALLDVRQAQDAGDAEAENRARLAARDAKDSTDIAQAQKALAQEKADRDREITRLERDLAEERIDARKGIEDAQRDLARTIDDTSEQIEEAVRRVEDAERDSARAIADAQRGLADAHREGAEAVSDAQRAVDKYADSVEKARTATQLLNKDTETLISTAETLRGIFEAPLDGFGAGQEGNASDSLGDIFGRALEGRAVGGAMRRGRAYVTGEVGPELVIPQSNATVVPNDQVIRALREIAGNTAGGRGNIQVVVPHQDPRVLANELSYRFGGVR